MKNKAKETKKAPFCHPVLT